MGGAPSPHPVALEVLIATGCWVWWKQDKGTFGVGYLFRDVVARCRFFTPTGHTKTFTDSLLWSVEVGKSVGGPITLETFSGDIPKAQSITFPSGIVATNSFPPNISSITYDNNAVKLGVYLNAVGPEGPTLSGNITWRFPYPIRAFAAQFLSVKYGGVELTTDFPGAPWMLNGQVGGSNGYFGFVNHGLALLGGPEYGMSAILCAPPVLPHRLHSMHWVGSGGGQGASGTHCDSGHSGQWSSLVPGAMVGWGGRAPPPTPSQPCG